MLNRTTYVKLQHYINLHRLLQLLECFSTSYDFISQIEKVVSSRSDGKFLVSLCSQCFFQILSAKEQIQLRTPKNKERSVYGIPAARKEHGVQNRSRDRTKIGASALWAGVTTCKSNISCSFDLHFTILPFPFFYVPPSYLLAVVIPFWKTRYGDLVISARWTVGFALERC